MRIPIFSFEFLILFSRYLFIYFDQAFTSKIPIFDYYPFLRNYDIFIYFGDALDERRIYMDRRASFPNYQDIWYFDLIKRPLDIYAKIRIISERRLS